MAEDGLRGLSDGLRGLSDGLRGLTDGSRGLTDGLGELTRIILLIAENRPVQKRQNALLQLMITST